MGNRPAGDPILFAETDDTYPDGPQVGQTTKERPSQGIIDRGFYPDRKVPAKFVNFVLNDVTVRAGYIDLIDVLNWDAPDDGIQVSSSIESPYAIIWHPFARAYVVVQDNAGTMHVYYSPDAKTNWLEVGGASFGSNGECLAMSPVTFAVLVPERSGGVMHYLDSPNLAQSTPGATFSNFTVHGAVGGLDSGAPFIVFGKDSSNNRPKMYTVTEGPVAATKRDLTGEAALNTAVIGVAVGTDRVVAIDDAGHVWYHVGNGAATWLAANGGSPIVASPQGISYDAVNDVFWVIDNGSDVYTSQDGISWTLQDVLTDFSFEASGSIISFNGVWIAKGSVTGTGLGGTRMLHSTDLGVTWRETPAPVQWASICSEAGRRLVAIDADGNTVRSLRTRL